MTHQPYLDMIFEDPQELSSEQSVMLENHLSNCNHCQELANAYKSLETEFQRTEMVEPPPGFAMRWQDRLMEKQHTTHRKQVGLTLGVVLSCLLVLSGLMLVLIWPLLRSPSILVWTWVYQLYVLFSYMDVLESFVSPILNVTFSAVPLITYVFLVGFASVLAVLWVVSYRVLTNPRRTIQ